MWGANAKHAVVPGEQKKARENAKPVGTKKKRGKNQIVGCGDCSKGGKRGRSGGGNGGRGVSGR